MATAAQRKPHSHPDFPLLWLLSSVIWCTLVYWWRPPITKKPQHKMSSHSKGHMHLHLSPRHHSHHRNHTHDPHGHSTPQCTIPFLGLILCRVHRRFRSGQLPIIPVIGVYNYLTYFLAQMWPNLDAQRDFSFLSHMRKKVLPPMHLTVVTKVHFFVQI